MQERGGSSANVLVAPGIDRGSHVGLLYRRRRDTSRGKWSKQGDTIGGGGKGEWIEMASRRQKAPGQVDRGWDRRYEDWQHQGRIVNRSDRSRVMDEARVQHHDGSRVFAADGDHHGVHRATLRHSSGVRPSGRNHGRD